MLDLWFRQLPKAEQEERKRFIQSNKKVLDLLDEILYNISIEESKSSKEDYDSPSWAYRQAHKNGELAMIDKIRKIIQIKEI